MKEFRATGRHAHTLADGRQVQPGETALVDEADPHNAALTADGHLLEIPTKPTKSELMDRAKALDIEGRTTMNADQLASAIAAAESAPNEEDRS